MTQVRNGPLRDVRVLDLTRFYSGPFATLLLAGFGADVIRIDRPSAGEPSMTSPPFFGVHGVSLTQKTETDVGLAYLKRCRAKKSITLDLTHRDGLAVFKRLLQQSDVVVENFRPGVAKKLGVDFESNRETKPSIVHCAITGYGSTGSQSRSKAYDLMVQADAGLMSVTGDSGGLPHKAGTALADGISGSFAVAGILAALLESRKTGIGQFVDISMVDCLVSLVLDEPLDCYQQLSLPVRQGNRIMRFSPFNLFSTLDRPVVIGVATKREWFALLSAMRRSELAENHDWQSVSWRIENNAKVDELVSSWTRTLSSKEVLETLAAHDVPSSFVRGIDDLLSWDVLRERDMIARITPDAPGAKASAAAAGFPIKLSETPCGYSGRAPRHGEHNDLIFGDLLHLKSLDRDRLKALGVI